MRNLLFFLLSCGATFLMQAQEPVYVHLSEKNGLPAKEFYNILEDSKGFIWLNANRGLFKFDGKTYQNYTHEQQRGLSVFNIKEDALGRIWCNNISGQFFYFQDNTLHLFTDLSNLLKGELVDFAIQKEYLFVFGMRTIYKVHLVTKAITTIKKIDDYIFGPPSIINDIAYFANINGVYHISPNQQINTSASLNLNFRDAKGKKIEADRPAIFKVGNSLFFRQYRNHAHTFLELDLSANTKMQVSDFKAITNEIIYYQFTTKNAVWFATNSGVWVFERTDSSFKLKKRFLTQKRVTKIIKDKDANYWLTTLNDGIYVIPNIDIETSSIPKKHANITSLDAVNDSTLFFGNTIGNVGFYNTTTNTSTIIKLSKLKDRISTLRYHPSLKTIFISGDVNGFILNPKTLHFKKDNSLITAKSLTPLFGEQLLITTNNAVRVFNNQSFDSPENSLSRQRLRTYASYHDKIKRNTYIAYIDELIRYDSLWNAKPIRYKNKPIYGMSITKTINEIIWVATFKNGIYGIKNDSVLQHYSTENGLTSNHIGKIKADQNKLWIATDNSIQLLDVVTQKTQTFTKSDGVVSYDISGIEPLQDKVYFSSNEGLFSIHKNPIQKTQQPQIYFNTIEINEKDTLIASSYSLKYNQNAIKIGFNVNGLLYNQKNQYNYRLKGFNSKWLTTDIGENTVKYNSLPAGNYTFEVRPIVNSNPVEERVKSIDFTINKPFWKTWWFLFGIGVVLFGSIIFYYRRKLKLDVRKRKAELEKISLEKELITLNLTALRSQMNPHFIFNSLNSIQDLILKKDTEASYDYIVLFAELIRNSLSYSSEDFISIDKELRFLNVYLQLEQLRFGSDFSYNIASLMDDSLEIPSLLIQPFIENALVHGIMHKKGKKELQIDFTFTNEKLQCIITDNGIGRKKAGVIALRQGKHHNAFALQAIEKRLEIFKKQFGGIIGYTIEDLYHNTTATGTKVTVTMPFKKRY